MQQNLPQSKYEDIDPATLSSGISGYIITKLQSIAEAAKETFAADLCIIIGVNPNTNNMISPIIKVGDLLAPQETYSETALFYDPDITDHLQKHDPWFTTEIPTETTNQNTLVSREAIRSTSALVIRTADEQIFGILYLHFRTSQTFNTDWFNTLRTFAEQASAFLLETWLLYHYTQIEQIEQEINRNLSSVEGLFKHLQLYLTRVLDTSYSILLAVYPLQGKTFTIFVNEGERIVTEAESSPLGGACQYATDTQETLIIRCLSQEEAILPYKLVSMKETTPKEFYIFIPLILRGDTFGVLSLQHTAPSAYNQKNLPALKLLANHVALALRNISLYMNLQRLNTTGHMLRESLNHQQFLQAIVERIREDTQADIVVLYPYDAKLQLFIIPPYLSGPLFSSSPLNMDLSRSDDVVRLMLHQRRPIFAHNSQTLYKEHLQGNLYRRLGSFEEREQIQSTAAITLWLEQEIVGVLFLNFRQTQRFDMPQKLFIEALTNYVTIAIRRAKFVEIFIEHNTIKQEILKQIDQEVNHSLDLDHVLKTILEQANILFKAHEASILLYHKDEQTLEVMASLPAEVGKGQIIPLKATKGITLMALKEKRAIRVDDVHDPIWRELYLPTENMVNSVSELDVPLLDENEVVGVLNFESIYPAAFQEDDVKFLEVLAGHTVLAIKRARDYALQAQYARREAALHDISKKMIGQFDSGVSFQPILQYALELTKSTIGSLYIYTPETQRLSRVVEQGADDNQKLHPYTEQSIISYVADTKKALSIDTTSSPWQHPIPFPEGIHFALAVPLLAGEELRGILKVESHTNRFHKNDENLLVGLAQLAVLALEHVERHQYALHEKKRFALLYKVAEELGNLSEIEQLEVAYQVTKSIAREYDQQDVLILRRSESPSASLSNDQIFSIHFKEEQYGYLVRAFSPPHSRDKEDTLFFNGLAQQLASTIYRIETTYSKREHEARARLTSLILEVAHRFGNDAGLIKSYVNDIRRELEHLRIASNPLIDRKLRAITQAIQNTLARNRDVFHVLEHTPRPTAELLSIHELFDDVEREVQERLMATTCSIAIQREMHDEEIFALATRTEVINILHNLVTNAIDAMAQKGTITLRAWADERYAFLEITDNGSGISSDLHEKIFYSSYSTKNSTGVGLFNAVQAARNNNGDLKLVSSQPGKGSTFRLLLPNAHTKRQIHLPQQDSQKELYL